MTLKNLSKNGKKLTLRYDLSWRDINIILQEAGSTSESESVKEKALAYANEVPAQNDIYPPGVEAIPASKPNWDG